MEEDHYEKMGDLFGYVGDDVRAGEHFLCKGQCEGADRNAGPDAGAYPGTDAGAYPGTAGRAYPGTADRAGNTGGVKRFAECKP